jgi:hypothetical protein
MMLRLKQHKVILSAIIVLGVILLGMPAVYAEDGLLDPERGEGEAISDTIYEEENFDVDLEVDSDNIFILGPGERIEDIAPVLGSANSDLVYTPVTPCRIIDTRFASGVLAGRIGPNSGKQFQVNMGNYSSQGGYAGSCGIPINPAAVAINVASTDQTGTGHIRVIVTGGGIPLAALLNYEAGTNISNAAVVRSLETGINDIFIYSGVSASHVVVDIMGYFAAPLRTPVDNYVNYASDTNVPAGDYFDVFSPACPAGTRVTGGGFIGSSYSGITFVSSRPQQGMNFGTLSGWNVADRWLCQGHNHSGSTRTIRCYVVCARIPGR